MVEETAEYKLVVERVTALMTRRSKDASYQNEYKKFVRFVIEKDIRGEGDFKYVHRGSVDQYFEEAVVLRTFQKAGASRIVQSLQWFYLNLETPSGPLKVWSPKVKEAINQQQENRKNTPNSSIRGCPHRGLKDVLSEADKKKIISHILRHRSDWGSLNTSFTWGNQAAVRGASTRKCGFAELYMSVGFGPAKEGPRASTLLLVLRPGEMNKDRFTTARMVGCWRHREPLLCAVGHLSLHMINRLRLDSDIHFLHEELTEDADWWGTPLIDFDTLNDETGPMKEVYKATGVEGCKLTHNRTYAVQQAGSAGLAPYQINSLTKHMIEKIHKSYLPELDKEACKVMAGFSKDEGYFVEREHLELPMPIETLIVLLLPEYPNWLAQHESQDGDKSPCCRKFLYEVIPHMVRVIVQDGIYLVRDFPEHEMSNYLKVRLSIYVCFCSNC